LGAFILLLLLGTEILSWQVALLIPLAALAGGFYIARRRLPSAYLTAQIIDRRVGLHDTISTALFFNDRQRSARISPDVVRLQAQSAEQLAQSVDVRQAVPYSIPRAAYTMAALFLVAGSLFALRYGVSRRLDLKQPLASMLHQTFAAEMPEKVARNKMPKVPRPDVAPDSDMASDEQSDRRAGDPQDDGTEQAEVGNDPFPGKTDSKNGDGSKKSQDGQKDANGEQQDGSSDHQAGSDSEEASSGQQGGNKQDSKEGNSKQDSNSSGDNNSLMSKVKDAVQNLLSRMKPQQGQNGQQQSGEQNGQQAKGQQNGAKQQSAKNGQQQGGQQQADAQDGQAGEQSQNAHEQQGKGSGNSDSKQASKQPGSGVGSQDGEKRLKQAEQLAAMGKISEIIGKRSQTISGETTIEVQATSQQLRTQYSNRAVQHTQAGAEISRDEIPVALQTYVEHYFEQVRKQVPPAAATKK